MSRPSSPAQFHGVPSNQSPRYQHSPAISDGDGFQGLPSGSPGPSTWRSSSLRNANMFDDGGYHTPGSGAESQAQNDSQDEDTQGHAETSRSASARQTMTRVAKACVPCSTKKRRCDGGKPECKVCMVLGTPCTYENKGLKRGPPKGFRSGPKESAKARLLRNLETTIRDLAQQMGSEESALEIVRISRDRGVMLPSSLGDEGPASKRARNSAVDNSNSKEDGEDEGEEEDFLGISEQGSVRHFGSSSGIQLLHTQHPAAHSDRRPPHLRENSQAKKTGTNGNAAPYPLPTVTNRLHGIAGNTSHSNSPTHSPSQAKQSNASVTSHKGTISTLMNRRLFYSYWEGFHPFWPVLYKPAFDELSIDRLPSLLDEALINAIYAIAVCVASPALYADAESELGDSPAGEVFFHRAEIHLFEGDTTPTPSLSSIQVCFFLALYCQGSGQLSKAWIYSSLANSMSFDLGLHRHLHHFDNNLIEKESRVRLIHCVYIVSTILSAEMGRPPMMRSKDIDVPLLSEQEKDEFESDAMGSKLCVASCLNGGVRLFSIVETVLGQVHSFRRKAALRKMGSESTRRVVEEIGLRLENWRKTLPDVLKLSGDRKREDRLLPNFIALHLWYHTAVLLLNRPFIPHEEGSSLQEVLNDSCHAKCTRASNELFELLLQLSNSNNVNRLSTDLAYCIFTAAVMFLFNARLGQSASSSNEESSNANTAKVTELANEAKMQFLMCKEWLRSLSDRWPAASAHKQLLDGFSSVGEDVLRGSSTLQQTEALDEKPSWAPTPMSTWGISSERDGKDTVGKSEAATVPPSVDPANSAAFSLDRFTRDNASTFADAFGPSSFAPEGSQYMYYSNDASSSQGQVYPQSDPIYRFAPNIFDMENVYWNETAARNPASTEASMGLNNVVQQQRSSQSHMNFGTTPFSGGSANNNASNSNTVNNGKEGIPSSDARQLGTEHTSLAGGQQQSIEQALSHVPTQQQHSGASRLQMLAQATTADMQHVSPFSFHQEPSQPEWNDVINMLQLPPAFLQ